VKKLPRVVVYWGLVDMSKKAIAAKAKKGALTKDKKGKVLKINPAFAYVVPESVSSKTIHDYCSEVLYDYGSYVVEDRAIPDYRDGLKPVQRRVLMSMNRLGIHHNVKYRKSALVVGDAIGQYHPHGDGAVYNALVGMANSAVKLADGQGNWGSPVDEAAAMRYTEVRLTKFANTFLLDPGYMNVVPHEPNYENTTTLPVYFPSMLPTMLLIGNIGGIAYGVRACNPAFEVEGVVALTRKALSGKPVTELDCFEHLRISAPFGCRLMSSEEDVREFFRTGRATLKYAPIILVNEKKGIVEIKSYAPGFASVDTVEKAADKISELPKVAKWGSECGAKNPEAGPNGAYYYVVPKRGGGTEDLYDLADEIEKILTGTEYYNLGVTIRSATEKNKFAYCVFTKFFAQWARYRKQLELDYIEYLVQQRNAALRKQKLIIYAVKNRKTLLDVLKKALEAKDPDQYVAKAMKLSIEDAKFIMDMQLRKLAKLEEADLQKKINELKAEIEGLIADSKNPAPRIVRNLTQTLKAHMK
jgi:DNA gyrase/topoisomerase IV subunit A